MLPSSAEGNILLCLQTERVCVTLQGDPAPCGAAGPSALQVFCAQPYRLSLRGLPQPAASASLGPVRFGAYTPAPLLIARRACTLTVTPAQGHTAAFRCRELGHSSGVSGQAKAGAQSFRLCPGRAPGLVELTVQLDGVPHLRLLAEVVPAEQRAEAAYPAGDAAQKLCAQAAALLERRTLARSIPDGMDGMAVCLAVVRELTAGLLRETELLPQQPVGSFRSGVKPKRPAVRSGRYTLPDGGLGEAALGAPAVIYRLRRAVLPRRTLELAAQELGQLQRRLRHADREAADRLDTLRRTVSARLEALEDGRSTADDPGRESRLQQHLSLLEMSQSQREAAAAAGESALLQYESGCVLGLSRMPWDREPDETLPEDFSVRDVLVGCLRSHDQLDTCLQTRSYHIPAARLSPEQLPVRCVAIYQSPRFFGEQAGVRYYGTVTACTLVRRNEIAERPRASAEPYYRFVVRCWQQLEPPIGPQGMDRVSGLTNFFLLRHSPDVTALWLRAASELRFYVALCRAVQQAEENGGSHETLLRVSGSQLVFVCGTICIVRGGKTRAVIQMEEFRRASGPVFERICRKLLDLQEEG